jgi:hypothetical protein
LLSVDLDTVPAVATHRAPRRPLRLIRQWPLLLVLAGMAAGLGLVLADGHHQRGTVFFAGAICLAAVLRAVLPDGWAGLLRVRTRWIDTTTLLVLGLGGLLAAAALIQDWDADLMMRWFRAGQ